ncbi:thermonuclease family protein [Loktanella sp. DJP18]|uniref:thermonuclease family protein n=1 Tax=Loktanella sp. DJP18 TaxID=3409788 RepID=UPI003BB5209B
MRDIIKIITTLFRVGFALMGFAFKVLVFLLGLLFKLGGITPASFEAAVRVVDGDSLVATPNGTEIKIRLHGIDAPEYDQPEGPAATAMLRSLVRGETVTIHPVDRDRYDRLVARVTLADGTDVGREMVRRGMAIALMHHNKNYSYDQHQAQSDRAGFWASGGIVAPSAWRQARRG